jgi:hypothetical protein
LTALILILTFVMANSVFAHLVCDRITAGDLKFKTGWKMKHAQPGQLRVWAGRAGQF